MEKLYPYMEDSRGIDIMNKFERACQDNGLSLVITDADPSPNLFDKMIAFCQEVYPDSDTVNWATRGLQYPGFKALTLYDSQEEIAATCWFKSATTGDLGIDAEMLISNTQQQLGIPRANRIHCHNLAVGAMFRGLGIGSGLTWTARTRLRHPEGTIYSSRIHADNHASMASAIKTGRASTGIFDHEAQKYVWWGIIPPLSPAETMATPL